MPLQLLGNLKRAACLIHTTRGLNLVNFYVNCPLKMQQKCNCNFLKTEYGIRFTTAPPSTIIRVTGFPLICPLTYRGLRCLTGSLGFSKTAFLGPKFICATSAPPRPRQPAAGHLLQAPAGWVCSSVFGPNRLVLGFQPIYQKEAAPNVSSFFLRF